MTPEDHFAHFRERAQERYDIKVEYGDWQAINSVIKNQMRGGTLMSHRRDGEVWHLTKGPFVKKPMFIIFDRGMAVTCLPPTPQLWKTLHSVQAKAKRGKPIPQRVVVEEDDMHFRHCYHSMLDYYGHELTMEEWQDWNKALAEKKVIYLQKDDGVKSGRLLDKGRSLVVAYRGSKIVDVRPPTSYWQNKARRVVARTTSVSAILARKIKEQRITF